MFNSTANSRLRRYVSLLAGILLLAGCGFSSESTEDAIRRVRAEREAAGLYYHIESDFEARRVTFTYLSPEERRMSFEEFDQFVHSLIDGHTRASDGIFHGIQIEYTDPDGNLYLWYPGNRRIVRGKYRTRFGRNDTPLLICFTYEPDTYNPGTGVTGPVEECTSAYSYISNAQGRRASRNGDPFNLSTGTLPFVLNKDQLITWPDKEPLFGDQERYPLAPKKKCRVKPGFC